MFCICLWFHIICVWIGEYQVLGSVNDNNGLHSTYYVRGWGEYRVRNVFETPPIFVSHAWKQLSWRPLRRIFQMARMLPVARTCHTPDLTMHPQYQNECYWSSNYIENTCRLSGKLSQADNCCKNNTHGNMLNLQRSPAIMRRLAIEGKCHPLNYPKLRLKMVPFSHYLQPYDEQEFTTGLKMGAFCSAHPHNFEAWLTSALNQLYTHPPCACCLSWWFSFS